MGSISVTQSCLLLSDIHLQHPAEPAARWFGDEIAEATQRQSQIFILGDLFEAWIGDDAPGEIGQWVGEKISLAKDAGCPIYFLHGNRDFLLGQDYAERYGMQILNGPSIVQMRQGPTLLLHGDELCTDDFKYQAFRQQVRNKDWQKAFLSQSIAERIKQAQAARAASSEHTQNVKEEIMDVNEEAVQRMFSHFGVRHMIHGHTHRPALHRYSHQQGERTRLVLGDWYQQAAPYWLDEEVVLTS